MYRLFLTKKYLRSKLLPYLAVVVVAVCVMLMTTWVSLMTGFLGKVESAARGLFGDIVIEPTSNHRGIAWYDEFIARMKQEVPEVDAAGPFVLSVGMLRVAEDPNFRQYVQVAGIRLPQQVEVTDFEHGLFVQKDWPEPTFAPPLEDAIERIQEHRELMRTVVEREFADAIETLSAERRDELFANWYMLQDFLQPFADTDEKRVLLRRIANAGMLQESALHTLRSGQVARSRVETLHKQLKEAKQRGARPVELDALREAIERMEQRNGLEPPENRMILGLGISGLSFRTDQGETIRYLVPGHGVTLYVFPVGRRFSATDLSPNVRQMMVIDDNHADVSSIDSKTVYVPFETLQVLNNMAGEYSATDPEELISPPRCSQIHIKVSGGGDEAYLREVAGKIRSCWERFMAEYQDQPTDLWPVVGEVGIDTWRQRQAQVIAPLEKQRTLAMIVTGIMSINTVAVVLIILYTIVVQKTREVGVLKAIGASDSGVAGLFLTYGAFIGLVGSVVGLGLSYLVVHNINQIESFVDSVFGFTFWSREQFMFEYIPNSMDWFSALCIVIGTILCALLGSVWPAVRAARMQPVEALRYE